MLLKMEQGLQGRRIIAHDIETVKNHIIPNPSRELAIRLPSGPMRENLPQTHPYF
jgi:hypothetical protein